MNFNELDLNSIEYVKVTYVNECNEKHEIKTLLKAVNAFEFILQYQDKKIFEASCPQYVLVKFVTNEAMYSCQTQFTKYDIIKTKKRSAILYFNKSDNLQRHQKREHYRINLEKAVAINCSKKNGEIDMYLSKTIDLSAGGVKVTYLKSLKNGKRVEKINFKGYAEIKLLLFLDADYPVVFEASIVRTEVQDEIYNYAFEFKNPNVKMVDEVLKYVAQRQAIEKNVKG